MVTKKDSYQSLAERMFKLHISEDHLVEKFVLGSGSGGQKINKTSSCVYLKHIPSGIEVKCQRERSREANRMIARQELCDKIETALLKEKQQKKALIAKLKRQNRRPSLTQKMKNVEQKRLHSQKKSSRKVKAEKE
jgi:peptide chain release factor